MPSGAVLEGRAPPLHPRALACLVSRDSELAYLLRSLIKLSPPPPHEPCQLRHALLPLASCPLPLHCLPGP